MWIGDTSRIAAAHRSGLPIEYHSGHGNGVGRTPAFEPETCGRDQQGASMMGNQPRNGYQLNRSDQVIIVAVAIAILILTGFLVGLLF
jgi:hypothetical protein